MVKSGFWREFISDPQSKAPAMSYARFQGHEELAKHFNSSAVLHEQDPEKRPIFRAEAACAAAKAQAQAQAPKAVDYREDGGTGATGSPKEARTPLAESVLQFPVPQGSGSPETRGSQEREDTAPAKVLPAGGPFFQPAAAAPESEQDLHAALQRGAQEIAAILMRKPSRELPRVDDESQIHSMSIGA
mmetsp:Transcript_29470/g.90717  ORF Transcript_29470/g.90717 Transcript_29470/m.90717 type:complete len:188 (-) Transcript_29470:239-802(-)